jgi:hypothetical protein
VRGAGRLSRARIGVYGYSLGGATGLEVYDGLESFRAHSTGPRPLDRSGTTGHQAFTDIVWLVGQLGANPADFLLGTVDPGDAVAA